MPRVDKRVKRKKRVAEKRAREQRRLRARRLAGEEPPPPSLIRRMVRDHLDILQNIEFVLVKASSIFPEIDDRTLYAALRAYLTKETPDDKDVRLVLDMLEQIRAIRSDVDEKVWSDGIRVVMGSIRNRSAMIPGEKSYLRFVEEYIV